MKLGYLSTVEEPVSIVGTRFGPKRNRFASFGQAVSVSPDESGNCPSGYDMNYVSGLCDPSFAAIAPASNAVPIPASGACPDGYVISSSPGMCQTQSSYDAGQQAVQDATVNVGGSVVDAGQINAQSGPVEDTLLAADAAVDKIFGTHWAAERFAAEAAAAGTPLSQAQIDALKAKDQALISQAGQQTVQQVEDAATSGLTTIRMLLAGLSIAAAAAGTWYLGSKVVRLKRRTA